MPLTKDPSGCSATVPVHLCETCLSESFCFVVFSMASNALHVSDLDTGI